MTFLLRFASEYTRFKFYAACKVAIRWMGLMFTLLAEYVAHVTLHRRQLGLLQRQLTAKQIPDGILWVRNYEEDACLTAFPFRISNRWMLRKFHRQSLGLQMRIMTQAHNEDLRPARVVMTPELEAEAQDVQLWNAWHRTLKYS